MSKLQLTGELGFGGLGTTSWVEWLADFWVNPLADSLADSLADFVADFWRISGEEFPALFACVFSIGIGRNSSPEIHPKFTLGFTTQFGLGPHLAANPP